MDSSMRLWKYWFVEDEHGFPHCYVLDGDGSAIRGETITNGFRWGSVLVDGD